jgi:hypothetical protein
VEGLFQCRRGQLPTTGAVWRQQEKSWEEIDSISLEKLSSVSSTYQTPKKVKVGTLLEALSDTMPIGLGKTEEVSRIIDPGTVEGAEKRESVEAESLRTVLAEWNKLGAKFELFNAEFVNLGNSEEKYQDAISTTVVKIHEAMQDTDAQVALLTARVGKDVTEASDMGSDSVWDAIRNLCDTMDDGHKRM